MNGPVTLFYLYSLADKQFLCVLEKQLSILTRQGLIAGWHQGCVQPGQSFAQVLTQHLEQAEIIVLLVSADLFNSDQEHNLLQEALRRHDNQGVPLVPVIVRPVDWRSTLLGGMQVLPTNGRPVTTWPTPEEAWLEVTQHIRSLLEQQGRVSIATPLLENPYRGLAAFQEQHAPFFFGREDLTRQLWQAFYKRYKQTARPCLLTILGPSGSGKSSLARAGLVPLLKRQPMPASTGVRVAVMSPGERPIERLARVLQSLLPPSELRAAQIQKIEEELLRRPSENGVYEGLRRFASELPSIEQQPILLLVDQFEEVYAHRTPLADKNIFVKLLLHAASDHERHVSLVLTLRSDFFEETRQDVELNRAIADKETHILVPVMNREELRRAIVVPAAQQGRSLDGSTVDLLLSEAVGRDGALPLLEFALTRIWEGLTRSVAPAQTLAAMGGVGGALAGEAQQIYDALGDTEKEIARRAFLGMVQLGEGTKDVRRRTRVDTLVAQHETFDQVLAILRRFTQPGARLITLSVDEQSREFTEVTHEALFDHWRLLREWIAKGREDLRFHRRLEEAAQGWDLRGRPVGLLWRPPDLDVLHEYSERARKGMNSLLWQFYEHSARHYQQEQRERASARLRLRVAIIGATLAILTAFVAWTTQRSRLAQQEARQMAEQARQNAELARRRYIDTVESYRRIRDFARSVDTDPRLIDVVERVRLLESTGQTLEAVSVLREAQEFLERESLQMPMILGVGTRRRTDELVTRLFLDLLLRLSKTDEAAGIARRARLRGLWAYQLRMRLSSLNEHNRMGWESAIQEYQKVRSDINDLLSAESNEAMDLRLTIREERNLKENYLIAHLDQALPQRVLNEWTGPSLAIPKEGELFLIYSPLQQGMAGFAYSSNERLAKNPFGWSQVKTVTPRVPLPCDVSAGGQAPAENISGRPTAQAPDRVSRCDHPKAKNLGSIEPHANPEILARQLLLPFEASISKATRIRIIPSADIEDVDFHALPWKGEVLLSHAIIEYALDLPTVPREADHQDRNCAVVVADPMGNLPNIRASTTSAIASLQRTWASVHSMVGPQRLGTWPGMPSPSDPPPVQGTQMRSLMAQCEFFHFAGHSMVKGDDGWQTSLFGSDEVLLTTGDLLAIPKLPRWAILVGPWVGRDGMQGMGLMQIFLVRGTDAVLLANRRDTTERFAGKFTMALYGRGTLQPQMDLAAIARQALLVLRQQGEREWASYRVFVR